MILLFHSRRKYPSLLFVIFFPNLYAVDEHENFNFVYFNKFYITKYIYSML